MSNNQHVYIFKLIERGTMISIQITFYYVSEIVLTMELVKHLFNFSLH